MKMNTNFFHLLLFILLISGVTVTGVVAQDEQTITDMAGRDVILPQHVERVVTVGSVAVINSILITLGEQSTIVSGLPQSFLSGRFIYLRQFAPNTVNATVVEGGKAGVNVETATSLKPDLVFTFDKKQADTLQSQGLNTVYLSWWNNGPEDMKNLMIKLGEIYSIPEKAETYNSYLDEKINTINNRVSDVPTEKKPKVLVCNFKSLKSYQSADWWIEKAGGINVAHDDFIANDFSFDLEEFTSWNPDYIFVYDPSNKDAIYNDTRLEGITAIKNKNVYVVPSGMGPWLATSEQPLALMWAAKQIYPDKFKDIDIPKEMKKFYQTFCDYEIPDSEITYILNGGVN